MRVVEVYIETIAIDHNDTCSCKGRNHNETNDLCGLTFSIHVTN